MQGFASTKQLFLDLLFPAFCAGCGSEGAVFCDACRALLLFIPPSCFVCKKLVPPADGVPAGRTCAPCRKKSRIYAFFSPFSYDAAGVRTLVHDLKYRRMQGNAAILAGMLYRAIAYHGVVLSRHALIVPIPLYKARERVRGFNQARLIAHALGTRMGIPVRADILLKTKKTAPQMALRREERLTNLVGAFAVSDTESVRNRTIILMDDIKTTGTTLEEAAKVLKAAGAKRIWAITVAH
ncbi:MAG: hypothetical protein A3B34_01290 [Candidatus Sungbacteria bacterium RIFCSPLOWO2_01_FULL_54_21]|uniref:Phosphoribosyltransferase domain-containing protein n=2 Tax=Candidatus Sungiibacteriota TaxID=1817917 RepID=A0A1G2L6T0_9BACT|nr:MAG: hypothetical protein A3B34_01290 [Candidatus Sungbacteria bacterium RIFCSPLOWO2_01_FULL_54_21]